MDALKGKYMYEQQSGPSITKKELPAKKRKRVELAAAEARIQWTEPMLRGFDSIKKGLQEAVDLYLPDPDGKWKITTDACDYATGGVLEQQGTNRRWDPVAFFSRILQGSSGMQNYAYPDKNSPEFEKQAIPGRGQMGWTVREKETYASVCALLKFQSWIAGQEVTVCTDHSSILQWYQEDLCTISGLLGRGGCWHEFLSRFNLHIEYLPGERNEVGIPCPDGHTLQGNCRTQRFMVLPWMLRDRPWMISENRPEHGNFCCKNTLGNFWTLLLLHLYLFLPSPFLPLNVMSLPLQIQVQFKCTHNLRSLCRIPYLMYVLLLNLPLLNMWLLCVTFHGTCQGQCSTPFLS